MRRLFFVCCFMFATTFLSLVVTHGQTVQTVQTAKPVSAQTAKPTKPASPAVARPVVKPVVSAPAMTNEEVVGLVKDIRSGVYTEDEVATMVREARKNFDFSVIGRKVLDDAQVPVSIQRAMHDLPAITATSSAPAIVAPLAPQNAVGDVVIPDGTELRLRLVQAVSSATAKVDERIRFEATQDILLNGKVVIAQGAVGTGTVTEAQQKKNFGRSGKLDFTIDTVKAVDGQNIRLRVTKSRQGNESYVKAGVITYFTGIGGLFVHGKDVVVDAGTEYPIYIDGDRKINLAAVQK